MRAGTLRRLRDCRRGATAVEFALIALVLVQLSVACFEAMVAVNAWSTLQWACDEAARYAMTHQAATSSQIRAYAAGKAAEAGYPASRGMGFSVGKSTMGGVGRATISGSYVPVGTATECGDLTRGTVQVSKQQ